MKMSARDEIIRKAVLEKLSPGFSFYSCDDILTVAEIDEAQLKEIAEGIISTAKKPRGTKKPAPKRRNKAKT